MTTGGRAVLYLGVTSPGSRRPPWNAILLALGIVSLGTRPLIAAAAPSGATRPEPVNEASVTPTDAAKTARPPDLTALREQETTLRRELATLHALMAGRTADGLPLSKLFPIHLDDEAAVAELKETLRRSLAERQAAAAPHEDLTPRLDTPEAEETSTTDATEGLPESSAPPESAEAPLGSAEAPTPSQTPEDTARAVLLALEDEVLAAKIEVLALPAAERVRIVQAEAEALRSAQERATAEAAERDAAEEIRRAEAARQRAVEAAMAARTAIQRKLAEERASAETVRRDQAQLRARLAEQRRLFEERREAGDWPGRDLVLKVKDVRPGTEAATELYDELVVALGDTRETLRATLVDAEDSIDAPRYVPDLPALDDESDASLRIAAGALRQSAADLDGSAAILESDARDLALDVLDVLFDYESVLYAARIELLDKLPAAKRRAVLGLGREGIAQLRRELDRLVLAARWYRIERQSTPGRLLRGALDVYVIAHFVSRFFWLIFLIGTAVYVHRRAPRALPALRAAVVRGVRRAWLVRGLQGLLAILTALAGPLVFLAAVLLGWPALAEAQAFGEVQVLHIVLLYLATYRLGLRAAHLGIEGLARRRVDAATSAKILRSLQIIGRTALALAIFLTISERILGKGYLYRLVLGFAWVCALPIAYVLLQWWRATIADAYLRFRPDGALAEAVRRTRERWYGFFVAIAALAILFVAWLVRGARGFVLGFEQSRKALAFMFRRRLERQAEESDEPVIVELPADLDACLAAGAAGNDGALLVDHFPGLAETSADLARWCDGDFVGSTLVVGGRGVGKTTWLCRAKDDAARRGLIVARLSMNERILDVAGLLDALGDALDAPSDVRTSVRSFATWLDAGPRRLVAIDDVHGLFLRGVETDAAWDALDDLIALSGRHCYWLATIAALPYEYIAWVRRGRGMYREVVVLDVWPEEAIARLLTRRIEAAGYEVLYHDLVVDKVAGVNAEAQLVSTAAEYARLVWDYADGSPAVALDCWRSSLVPDGDRRVRVRLFRRPRESILEEFEDVDRFVLASVLWHGHLTPCEAALSLCYPRDRCAEGLDLLVEKGVLVRRGDRYSPHISWLPAVFRYLRRHHLIETI